jgi:hypothetical protein
MYRIGCIKKLLKTQWKKRLVIINQRTKVQKSGTWENEKGWKNLANYIKWKP